MPRLLKNGRVKRFINQDEIVHAITNPPVDTRAYFRGTCLKGFPMRFTARVGTRMIFALMAHLWIRF